MVVDIEWMTELGLPIPAFIVEIDHPHRLYSGDGKLLIAKRNMLHETMLIAEKERPIEWRLNPATGNYEGFTQPSEHGGR
jgi:hypothetical protein